jgi:hypothetical protein
VKRWARRLSGAVASLALAGCGTAPPAAPTREAYTALHLVTNGPYPLYASYGEWLTTRRQGVTLVETEKLTIDAARVARAQHRLRPNDGPALFKGCIFDVESTQADQQEVSYVWAFGKVVRCDEEVADDVLEPQMGVRPEKLRIYDGQLGYFPMSLLDPYSGSPPAPRH